MSRRFKVSIFVKPVWGKVTVRFLVFHPAPSKKKSMGDSHVELLTVRCPKKKGTIKKKELNRKLPWENGQLPDDLGALDPKSQHAHELLLGSRCPPCQDRVSAVPSEPI